MGIFRVGGFQVQFLLQINQSLSKSLNCREILPNSMQTTPNPPPNFSGFSTGSSV